MKIPEFLTSKLLKRTLIALLILIILILVLFFILRDSLLHAKVEEKINAFNSRYPATLVIEDSHFSGLTDVELSGIFIIPDEKDTLIQMENLKAGLKFFPFLFGKVKIASLEMTDIYLNVVSKDSIDNYSFLLRGRSDVAKENTGNPEESDFAASADRISKAVFGVLPDDIILRNVAVDLNIDSNALSMEVDQIQLMDKGFSFPLMMKEGTRSSVWNLSGTLNRAERTAELFVEPGILGDTIPFVKKMLGLNACFDSLRLGLEKNDYNGDIYELKGHIAAYNLSVNHGKISATDVKLKKTLFDCSFKLGADFIELDSSSSIVYNKLELNPYFLYQSLGSKKYTFSIHNEIDAQDFFSSLPAGLFTNFEDIETSGSLDFTINFYCDMNVPDSLIFTAALVGKDFSVTKYGVTDFSKIAGPFVHTVYEDGIEVASFLVGPDNPEFVPIEDISLPLKEAVMIAENGGTYYQTGFDVNSLRLAIIQDIKEGKFSRGGSTIEMQLMKNVFLTRSKTIARKVEELLIVWLVQSGNLCSQNRMFEVYLNIAEWGPGVYGIGQAAKFYFNKSASSLTVPESIFLASILPRPKWYKYSFDKAGNLDPEMNGSYFSAIASLLVERGTISPVDTINLLQNVKLRAESKQQILKDTSYFDVNEILRQDEQFLKKEQQDIRKPDQKGPGLSNQQRIRKNEQKENRPQDPLRK